MPDDRFAFVLASFAAAAMVLLARRSSISKKYIRIGKRSITARTVFTALLAITIVVILGVYIWESPRVVNLGSLIAALIGAVFGSFAAKFIASLFGSDFGERDPLRGAIILLLLSVGYSLPLYSDAMSEMVSRIGLSSIKTPFLELAINKPPGTSLIGVGGNQFNQTQVSRPGDPTPGLVWLRLDTGLAVDEPKPTLPADEAYIEFVENERFRGNEFKAMMTNVRTFLSSAEKLSNCLNAYAQLIPDARFFFTRMRPVLETLFVQLANAKIDVRGGKFEMVGPPESFTSNANVFISDTNLYYIGSDSPICSKIDTNWSDTTSTFTLNHFQPYVALILADLLIANGSPDEAIAVLTNWLDLSTNLSRYPLIAKTVPEWFQLRVASRVSLLLAELAGQNTHGYHDFFVSYKNKFEKYVGSSKERLSLDRLPAKCKSWDKVPVVEQKLFFLMLANEDEALRTEVNFVGEEQRFEDLEKLNRRARFIASIGTECLPEYMGWEERRGRVADHLVTAGVLGLTIADRMSLIARSRGDRERAIEVAREAEKDLRTGHAELSNLVIEDRNKIRSGDPWSGQGFSWSDRVFTQSRWEKSYSLAARAMLQLRQKSE